MERIVVSVPFGDSLFLNLRLRLDGPALASAFPSPSGTLYSSILSELCWHPLPPVSVPFGDSLFLNEVKQMIQTDKLRVSVPFGDSLFLNQKSSSIIWLVRVVSVPFGDSLFLNEETIPELSQETEVSVPFGDSLFLNVHTAPRFISKGQSFPSPSGTLYSSIKNLLFVPKRWNNLSVPFGDSLFLNKREC